MSGLAELFEPAAKGCGWKRYVNSQTFHLTAPSPPSGGSLSPFAPHLQEIRRRSACVNGLNSQWISIELTVAPLLELLSPFRFGGRAE